MLPGLPPVFRFKMASKVICAPPTRSLKVVTLYHSMVSWLPVIFQTIIGSLPDLNRSVQYTAIVGKVGKLSRFVGTASEPGLLPPPNVIRPLEPGNNWLYV